MSAPAYDHPFYDGPTLDHLAAVYGDTTGYTFIGVGSDPYVTETGKVDHGNWTERSFRWPAEADELERYVLDNTRHDVYFTPGLSENPLRAFENDKGKPLRKPLPVATLWADLDSNPHPDRVRRLTLGGGWLVASGSAPDRRHLYLPFVEPAPPNVAEDLLRRLADWLDADPAPTRQNAYLRPAGTFNHKPPTLGTGEAGAVEMVGIPCQPRWTVDSLDDLLPLVEHAAISVEVPDAELIEPDLYDALGGVIEEELVAGMDRSKRTYAAVETCVNAGLGDGQIVTVMRLHQPTVDRHRTTAKLDRDVARCIAKVRASELTLKPTRPEAAPRTLLEVHAVFRRYLGDEYDLDALDITLATAAAEKLPGDPLWLLLVSGSGNAKTETVQSLRGSGAHVASTMSSDGALLSGTPNKQKAKDATGGLLRRIGDGGLLVIKDVTSILSMNRDSRAAVLAAIREIHDGHWVRYLGTDGGRTLEWTGRIVIIGAVTTAWDRAHDVIASMGDRFLIVRMDSTEGRMSAGRQSRRNVGHEEQMRSDMSEAVAGVLAGAHLDDDFELTDDEAETLLAAAELVTLARTGVDYDYRGGVIDAHAPEMPTRFMKQLVQLVRGAVAIGVDRSDALCLAIRCARDSMPPLRLAILDDIAAHPASTPTDVRRRLDKPRATADRQLQALHILGVLRLDEDERDDGKTTWRYSLADGIDPSTLKPLPDLSVHTHLNTEKGCQKDTKNGSHGEALWSATDISGNAPPLRVDDDREPF